jgi:hypothetical protein
MLRSLRRLMVAGATVLAAGATAVPAHAATPGPGAAGPGSISAAKVHAMRPVGSTAPPTVGKPSIRVGKDAPAGSGGLTYFFAPVQDRPRLFLDFWGSDFATDTDAGGFTGAQAETYVEDFLNEMAGSAWLSSQTQYCQADKQGMPDNATADQCGPINTRAGLPGAVSGVWVHPNTDPVAIAQPTLAQIAFEVALARMHFVLSPGDVNATILVFSPTGKSTFNIQGIGSFCAFHSFTFAGTTPTINNFGQGGSVFAYIPWLPDQGSSCHTNEVNGTNGPLGQGHFDGFSISTGHEIAEAITDPLPGIQDDLGNQFAGWLDNAGLETGDKCSRLQIWPERNITFGSDFFAVQPLWSDNTEACDLESVGGLSTNQPAIATQDSVHRDVFVRSSDGAVWTRSSNGVGWSAWSSLGGLSPSGPAAVSWASGRIDIFVRGMDNGLWHRGWTPAGWSPWQSLGGIITSAPAVASWAANRLDVVARGNDNALWHIGFDGTAWRNWESLGGAVNADPGAVSWGPNRIDVFIRSTDLGMWHKAWTGSSWSGWESHGGGFMSGFTASSTSVGQVSAYGVGLDHQVYRLSWNGSAWVGWQGLGGFLTQPPAAVAPPGGMSPVELVTTGISGTTERLVLGI